MSVACVGMLRWVNFDSLHRYLIQAGTLAGMIVVSVGIYLLAARALRCDELDEVIALRAQRCWRARRGVRREAADSQRDDSHLTEAQLEGVIRSFLSYLRVEKGVSMNTHDAYRRDVEKFQEFAAKKHLRLEEATRETIVDFLRSLYQRKLDSRSVARNLVTLRQFFRFALIEGIVKEDPTETVESPRFRMGLPRFLSVEEVDRLLAAPDAGTIIGLRDKAMIEVMYSAGLRVSELCGLRLSDFHFDAGYVRCMGKGSKERLVPIGRQAMEIVQRYLRDSRPKLLRENSPELSVLESAWRRMFAARLLEDGFGFRPESRPDRSS